jgi:hypothetical protein
MNWSARLDRVGPDILRLSTNARSARSASLLLGGTAESRKPQEATKRPWRFYYYHCDRPQRARVRNNLNPTRDSKITDRFAPTGARFVVP